MAEHAVIAHLKLSDEGLGTGDEVEAIHDLSDQLTEAIEENEAGEFDGDEFVRRTERGNYWRTERGHY